MNEVETHRLAKFLARAGVASRRDCEKLILAGRVSVNGEIVPSPAFNVTSDDDVLLDGKKLGKPPLRVWLYHKPAGLVTTSRDEKGRRTIYDALPAVLKNANTVGRLDLTSEGLLILTNDGELKRILELPETGWRRKYRVRAYGKAGDEKLDELRKGVNIDGEIFRPMEIVLDREKTDNRWYTVAIREGRNREIRRAFETIGLNVNRLIRTSYGPFQLGTMARGEVTELTPRAITTLLGGLLPRGAELADTPLDLTFVPEKLEKTERPDAGGERMPRRDARSNDRPSFDRGRDDRPKSDRSRDDKPRGDFKPRGDRPSFDRNRDDKPRGDFKPRGDRPSFDRNRDDKPRGDFKPRGDRPSFDRNRDDKPRGDFKPRGDRPSFDRNRDDKPRGDFKPRGDRPSFDRNRDDKPRGDFKPRGDRPSFDRNRDDKPRGDFKPRGDRPSFDRNRDDKPRGDFKPRGDRPSFDRKEKPRDFKPRGDRPARDNSPRDNRPANAPAPTKGAPKPFFSRAAKPKPESDSE